MWYFVRALFHIHELFQAWDYFMSFFYLKACEESRGGIVVAGKVGRDLKLNVTGFIKDFCFESGNRFLVVDKKEVGKGLCERGFWHDLSHGKDIDYNTMSQKIVCIIVSRL